MMPATLSIRPFTSPSASRPPRELFACCPSCGRHGWFRFCGVQKWSENVATACGLPAVMRLWICDYCKTTLTEPNLRR